MFNNGKRTNFTPYYKAQYRPSQTNKNKHFPLYIGDAPPPPHIAGETGVSCCPATLGNIRCKLEAGHEGQHVPDRIPHACHWPGCNVEVPPSMWGCKSHWFRLPKRLRDRIWETYRPGQEITKTPSAAYLKAAEEVQQWIRKNAK